MKLWRHGVAAAAVVSAGAIMVVACETDSGSPTERAGEARIDRRLRTHAVIPSSPTAQGLAYIEAVAAVQNRADASSDRAHKLSVLREGLALPVPAGLGEAEILRLELSARLGETLLEAPEGAATARDLLAPLLGTDRSLPLDRASARALITLGDAAVRTGDDALAAGSYWRSIRIMSDLRQELEP